MTGVWVYAASVALLVLHVGTLWYAYRNRQRTAAVGDQPDEFLIDGRIECPNCGEHNDEGYRYCRRCVSELPGSPPVVGAGPSTRRRQVF